VQCRQRRALGNELVTYELAVDERRPHRAVDVSYVGERRVERSGGGSGWGATVFITLFLVLLIAAVAARELPIEVLGIYADASVIAFVAYASDKSAAEMKRWRTKETTSRLFGLIGGWPVAWLAQRVFRHESRKHELQTVSWTTVVPNCGGFAGTSEGIPAGPPTCRRA
jgi:uncharacterized membrane protein YsdA (DUF1294 family)